MMRKICNILLISPRRSIWSTNTKISSLFENNKKLIKPWYSPPLSLLTIAAVTPKNIHIDLIDEDFESINFDIKYDLVGISSMTQQICRAYIIAEQFRQRSIPVVLGGIHATVMPEEALEHVDTVIIGEGELLWKEYLADIELGKQKRIYKNESGISFDLAQSPPPRYDLLKQEYYYKREDFFNMVPIQATRGCPRNCNFCVVTKIYGAKTRKKKIEQIIIEIKNIKALFKAPLIMFADDNLFADKKYAKDLLRSIFDLKISWVGQCDTSVINDSELIKIAYKSGCMMLLIGFESLNYDSLKEINSNGWKMNQLKNYTNVVKTLQENGIMVYAAFIVGHDQDNKSTFTNIRNFMIENHCSGQITILTPLPGSELYEKYKKEGRLIEETFWDKTNFFDIVFKPKAMTIDEIENGFIWLYEEIFNSSAFENRYKYMKEIYKKMPPKWN